jgi:4-amino-4-deoxy-L-arabinose transferase-like glycosyltransferase
MMAMWGVWAAVVVLFFSFSNNKLSSYILPALPALALLSAWRLDSMWLERKGLSAAESSILCICGGVTGGVFLIAGVLGWQWRHPPATPSRTAKQLGKIFNWKEQSQGVEMLWRKLTPLIDLAPYWIMLGALLLLSSIIILSFWRNTAKTFVAAVIISLALTVLTAHFLLPAWSRQEAEPVKALAQRTLPALERGEPLALYALHPTRISLRYRLGHTNQVFETSSQEIMQRAMEEAGHGYVLTKKDTPLPFLPGTIQQEATAGQWVLWRYDRLTD